MTGVAPVNVVMIGPPGAGKGTQAERIASERGIPKISTGDMLREAIQRGSELGLVAREIVDRGDLVGDDIMVAMVRERLARQDARVGFVLDGFPRTVPQAQALDALVSGRGPLIMLEIAVPEDEVLRRMTGRRVCESCGANAAPEDGQCGRCGGGLGLRSDDGAASVRQRRLGVYAAQTEPILAYYRDRPSFRSVDGAQSREAVTQELSAAIDAVLAQIGDIGGEAL